MLRRLIVNADDFGLTRGVSAGILGAAWHGIVTSTTLLATARVPEEDLAALRDSRLGVGLHVNLTLGRPVTGRSSLTDAEGSFVRDARVAAARATARDVEREVDAQLGRFETLLGRRPTHLDSHHHVGLLVPVRDVVLAAARRLGAAVRSQDATARARARSAGLRTPDHFFGESGPDAYWSPARTLIRLRALPVGVSEFMTHPGLVDPALAYSRYGRQRATELAGVGTPAARAAVAALGITLCHFGDL
ncbi:MAG: ChbG/HpnK family deacetylase [Candidatus Rokubacteria bacterium]|nr:ChbG/HpnK family deacetylase [Candidatus Rokubacteria bacterium]